MSRQGREYLLPGESRTSFRVTSETCTHQRIPLNICLQVRMAASGLRPEEATGEPPLTGKAIGIALVGDTLSALGASAMVAPFVR